MGKISGKGFLSLADWPVVDESKINEKFEQQERVVEKLAEDINHVSNLLKEREKKQPIRAFVYVLPNEMVFYSESIEKIRKKTGLEIEIFSVSDKEKYDPEGKSKKVKPNRPGIHLE